MRAAPVFLAVFLAGAGCGGGAGEVACADAQARLLSTEELGVPVVSVCTEEGACSPVGYYVGADGSVSVGNGDSGMCAAGSYLLVE